MIDSIPLWLWIVFTLLAAGSQAARNAMQRNLTGTLGTTGATHVRFLYGLPFAADRRTGRDAAANVAIFHFLEKLERRSFELQYFKAHILHSTLFERSEFLIDTGTSPQKNPSVCVCSTNLGFSVTSANGIRPNHGIPPPAYIHSF